MEKGKIKQLLITMVFAFVVVGTIYTLYDIFSIHTYSKVVNNDSILQSIDTDDMEITGYQIYQDEDIIKVGGGQFYLVDVESFLERTKSSFGTTITIEIYGEVEQEDIRIASYDLVLQAAQEEYPLAYVGLEQEVSLDSDTKYHAVLKVGDTEEKITLSNEQMKPIISSSKEYRINDAAINGNTIRLGELVSGSNTINSYTDIAIEYRYVKDPKKSLEDTDNYVVFTAISASLEDYQKQDNYQVFHYDGEEELEKKDLSAVVILSNETDQYIFYMDMDLTEVEQ